MKILYIFFCAVLLIYMIWPGPGKISEFSALPNSDKSKLAGDNITQVSNVAGYFSNNFREFVVPFYRNNYQSLSHSPFPPLRLNHPPEFAWTAIKMHTDSTYLEEFVYPLKGSLFVNGLEMFNPDGSPIFWGAPLLAQDDKFWLTKATLRFYPSGIVVRIIVWLTIIISITVLYKLGRRVIRQ